MEMKFRVRGMTCAACSSRVEKVTEQLPDVVKADVNLLAGSMVVHGNNLSADAICQAVSNAGYSAEIWGQEKQKKDTVNDGSSRTRHRIICSIVFLVVLMYFTMGHMLHLPLPSWYCGVENTMVAALLQFVLTLPVIVLNRDYYKRGIKALWHRAPNMDSLVAVGSGAAFLYGIAALFIIAYAQGQGDMTTVEKYGANLYFESSAMILTLITFGKHLEAKAKGKTGDAIRQLMDLSPKTATILADGSEVVVPIEQVKMGDVVIIRSGGSIPVDGTVISGRAAIDQSALTGESLPIEMSEGSRVSAGTINTEGYLQVRADKVGEDTTLHQVIRLVENAGGSKAPIARLADKIAGIFVPIVMAISVLTFGAWLLIGQTLEFALSAGIAVLVISCPCALGLATPVAIMVGTGKGAQLGVLFKTAQSLEMLHKIDTVVFDKTGTLTVGKPTVTETFPENIDKVRLLKIAASLEAKSEHPYAKAILAVAHNSDFVPAEDFQTIPGQGVCGIIEGIRYYAGNLRLMETVGIDVKTYDTLRSAGKTLLYFGCADGTYLGAIAVADVLKESAVDAVARLQARNLKIVMLSGDNSLTANAIARTVGIDHVISDVLPADKAAAIEKLKTSGSTVLMVGDGINDAPALACADVGMSIGGGTDIAIESADIVLMNDSLSSVADAIELSNATIRNIRQNLFWAFFYNSLGIPIAAGVLYPAFGIMLNPMLGAAAMSLSSVFVVSNALRLRFFHKKRLKNSEPLVENKEDCVMETIIKVNGMMCSHCKARVEDVCSKVAGTQSAVVDLQEKQVTVNGSADVSLLKKAITDAGYEVVE